MREEVKAVGGRWDPEKRMWHMSMEQVLQLGLTGRVDKVGQATRSDEPDLQGTGGV